VSNFPTQYSAIVTKMHAIEPIQYAKSRNFINGAVTYLSPYISRGVIDISQIAKIALERYPLYKIEKFISELAWREYFQRVWQHIGEGINSDIKNKQIEVAHNHLTLALLNKQTGIESIDKAIYYLEENGYMHNHVRMYLASIVCNIGKAHWHTPAKWMYYHLYDGDIASNQCSWQWVAGAFSSKKYYCNQENINKYTFSQQVQTYLDNDYEVLPTIAQPAPLQEHVPFNLTTNLNLNQYNLGNAQIIEQLDLKTLTGNICIYNSYNLDPLWHSDEDCQNILLLEPAHFEQYPISNKVLQFIIDLGNNINKLKIFVGSFNELKNNISTNSNIYYKEHPTTTHYKGIKEERSWLYPEVSGYFSSFFGYWKKCEKFQSNIKKWHQA
jgi:deoxyribodipyrimidine photo-lyase